MHAGSVNFFPIKSNTSHLIPKKKKTYQGTTFLWSNLTACSYYIECENTAWLYYPHGYGQGDWDTCRPDRVIIRAGQEQESMVKTHLMRDLYNGWMFGLRLYSCIIFSGIFHFLVPFLMKNKYSWHLKGTFLKPLELIQVYIVY